MMTHTDAIGVALELIGLGQIATRRLWVGWAFMVGGMAVVVFGGWR